MTQPQAGVRDALHAVLAGRYEVEDEVGRGAMSLVFRARDVRHQRIVAIKVLRPDLAAALGTDRFLREIAIAAHLSHPHIVPLHDSGEASGLLYYVMPYIEGESLRARLERERQLPLDDALQIAQEVADALAYAHARDVVHRDIKPENILLEAGHVVLADFGIARAIREAGEHRLTATGIAVGTPAYMSPEQASGDPRVDRRSDVYSLGCVLYEMLGGEPPHTGPTPQAILARQLAGEVRSLVPLRSSVTPALDRAIRRSLAPAPSDRYPTAEAFAAALTAARRAAGEPLARRPRRRMAIAATVAGLAVAATWVVTHRPRGVSPRDEPLGLALFPFRAAGEHGRDWSEAFADLLATALDGTPGIRVADPWSLWRPLRSDRSAPAGSPDPPEAERLAGRSRADRFLLGSVVQSRDRLELTVRIYRAGVAQPLATFAAAGSVDSLPALVQRVAVGVVTRVWEQRRSPSVPAIEAYATRSFDALKAYLWAKEAMRRGFVDSAGTAIDRAVALDSTFSLALVEAVRIKAWAQYMRGQPVTGLLELAQRAVSYADSLGERNRLRARAMLATVRSDGIVTAEALGRIIQLDSTDLEAWDLLAYCHLVYGWQYGKGAAEAWAANERILLLDSTYVPALVRGAHLGATSDDPVQVRLMLERLRRADTTNTLIRGSIWSLRSLLASDATFPTLADTVAAGTAAEWIAALRVLRDHRPARAELLLERVRRAAGPGFPARAAIGAAAQVAVAEGRLRQVDSALRAGAYRELPAFEHRLDWFLIAAAIAGVGDSEVTRHAVASLGTYVPVDSALAYFATRPVWGMGWALAAYAAMYGDTSVARHWYRTVGAFPAGTTPWDYRGALQSDIAARLADRRADLGRALLLAQRAYRLWEDHSETQLEGEPEPAMRLHLALLLRAAGRPDSAAVLLRSLVPPTTWLGFITARAYVELAEVAETRRDAAAAAHYYGKALALWERGGPEVEAWRAHARVGLRRVTAERSQ